VYWLVETLLARISDKLIAVSQQTVDDLVRLRVAPRERFAVIPIGLDLGALLCLPAEPDADTRALLDIADDDVVLAFVGRLVRIKRVDVLLRALALALPDAPALRLLIVGDGELRDELEALATALGIADRVVFLGFRFDLERIASGTDVAVLSSDNEGTPVALIEAGAAARPSIATDVGGRGRDRRPRHGQARASTRSAGVRGSAGRGRTRRRLRARLGTAARERVAPAYRAERLIADIEQLYGVLVAERFVDG